MPSRGAPLLLPSLLGLLGDWEGRDQSPLPGALGWWYTGEQLAGTGHMREVPGEPGALRADSHHPNCARTCPNTWLVCPLVKGCWSKAQECGTVQGQRPPGSFLGWVRTCPLPHVHVLIHGCVPMKCSSSPNTCVVTVLCFGCTLSFGGWASG